MVELRTLILTTAVAWLLVAGVLAFILRWRRTYPGFGLWALHEALVGTGMGLIGLRDLIPAWISIMVGNALVSAGALLSVLAVRVFLEGCPRWKTFAAVWVAYVGYAAWFTYAVPSFAARTLGVSVVLLGATTLLCADLLSAKAARYRSSARFTGTVMGLYAATMALRGVTTTMSGSGSGMWVIAPAAVATYLVTLAVGVLGAFGLVMMNHERLEHELTRARDELQATLDSLRATTEEVKILEGLLPICSWCKKIRDQEGGWTKMEVYIRDHSQAEFSHGICPDCMREHFGDAPGVLRGPSKDAQWVP
jgi:hypothetical protein